MVRIFAELCSLVGYMEVVNLLLTGNMLSLPCACAAFGVTKGLRELAGEDATEAAS